MSSSTVGFLFTFINLIYIVAQLLLLVVAVYFWRRYPRPSLYLATMASLEVFGTVLQTALQFAFNWGFLPNIDRYLFVHSLASLIRLAVHLLAMFFLAMAVYVARRPSPVPTTVTSPPPRTPGMENSDQAFSLDPSNPYTPPRQPR